jgi:hypothetical protein
MSAKFKPNKFGWGAIPKPVSTGLLPYRLWFQPQGIIHNSPVPGFNSPRIETHV